ncbi:mariner Mos1 transposase [Trichonephila clavipes]|nr:mariner Mos1 transposase [Trichonephila clavipes]
MRLSRALKEMLAHYYSKCNNIILIHDNARPQVAAPVKTYSETLNWEILPKLGLFNRHCPIRLSLVQIDGTWPVSAALHII